MPWTGVLQPHTFPPSRWRAAGPCSGRQGAACVWQVDGVHESCVCGQGSPKAYFFLFFFLIWFVMDEGNGGARAAGPPAVLCPTVTYKSFPEALLRRPPAIRNRRLALRRRKQQTRQATALSPMPRRQCVHLFKVFVQPTSTWSMYASFLFCFFAWCNLAKQMPV